MLVSFDRQKMMFKMRCPFKDTRKLRYIPAYDLVFLVDEIVLRSQTRRIIVLYDGELLIGVDNSANGPSYHVIGSNP